MAPPSGHVRELQMFASAGWQMSYGERAALEGILAQLSPHLAIEIGTASGGSLVRIAEHSDEVHSFDLVSPSEGLAGLGNLTFHTGDSHVLLPQVLAELASAGRSVTFVLIDGDHSAEGVRKDIQDLLDSDAVVNTVIVLHDTFNDEVRAGIESVEFAHWPKVSLIEFDLVPGYLARREPYRLQLWGGLGVIVVDSDRPAGDPRPVRDDRFHELLGLIRPARAAMAEIEHVGTTLDAKSRAEIEDLLASGWRERGAYTYALNEQIAGLRSRLDGIESSLSWRSTSPLRSIKRRLPGMRGQ